jgi:hypothetical protein
MAFETKNTGHPKEQLEIQIVQMITKYTEDLVSVLYEILSSIPWTLVDQREAIVAQPGKLFELSVN